MVSEKSTIELNNTEKKQREELLNLDRSELGIYMMKLDAEKSMSEPDQKKSVALQREIILRRDLIAAEQEEIKNRIKRDASARKDYQANVIDAEVASYNNAMDATFKYRNELANLGRTYIDLGIQITKGDDLTGEFAERQKKIAAEINTVWLREQAEAGKTWGIIGYTINQAADTATDAMTKWINNTDGLGRSWRTLGDTIKSVISDMLIQMEKAIIKQQLMQPLMDWASKGSNWSALGASVMGMFGGGKADGGSVSGGTSYLVGERGPEIFTPSTGGRITPNHELGGTSNNITINITNNGQESSSSGSGNSDQALALGKLIGAKVREVIVQESRQNGLLSRS
jgi:hypothetical protein